MVRLLAQDAADVAVVAALLQDAIILREDMTFDPRRRQFVMMVQRYCWEQDKTRTRVRSAVKIDFVDTAKVHGPLTAALALLDIQVAKVSTDADDPAVALTLVFSGGTRVRLVTDSPSLSLDDITQDWPTQHVPEHGL
jgi:Protein of unknown function (DUF2948)